MTGRTTKPPTLEVLEQNEETYGAKISCSVLLTVDATNILADNPDAEKRKQLLKQGLPWEVWEGEHRIWNSAEDGIPLDLKEGEATNGAVPAVEATGSAEVVVAELLQAVLATHPAWTIQKLYDATATESAAESAPKTAPQSLEGKWAAKLTAAVKLATAAKLAATRAAVAADMATAADSAATKAVASLTTATREMTDQNMAAAEADVWLAETAARDAAVAAARAADAATSTDSPTDIYRNFTIKVYADAEPIVLPIDMCVHGGCRKPKP